MRILKKLAFVLVSCLILGFIWLKQEEKLDCMYYAFPGKDGLTEIVIPDKIVKNKDCNELQAWMQTQTPQEMVMEIPDCPWGRDGIIGSFNIDGTNFCMPRPYINVDRYKLSGNTDELHLEFNYDTLEPVDPQVIASGKYNASDYIDLVIKKNPQRDACSSNQTCQQLYWTQLIYLLERYDSQPLDDTIQLHLEQKSFQGTDLDLYFVDNWRRACIVDGLTINADGKKKEVCQSKSPNIFILSNDNPINPSLWVECVDSRDYMDLRSSGYVCKIRNYYDDSNIVIDVYFDQSKYLSKYKDVLQKVETLVSRFQTFYNCHDRKVVDESVKIVVNKLEN